MAATKKGSNEAADLKRTEIKRMSLRDKGKRRSIARTPKRQATPWSVSGVARKETRQANRAVEKQNAGGGRR
ncbi:MAG TPA: hypothetical protein VF278_10880 [Pirellulales bacterium]